MTDFVKQRDDFKTSNRNQKGLHEGNFIEAVRACGVSFTIWRDKQGNLDWSSLMRPGKKKLLNHLPDHIPNIRPKDVCDKVTKL